MNERFEIRQWPGMVSVAAAGIVAALVSVAFAPPVVRTFGTTVDVMIGPAPPLKRSSPQAAVIAAGGDVLLKGLLAYGTLVGDLPGMRGLTLSVTSVSAERIQIIGEMADPAKLPLAVASAAEQLVTAAAAARVRAASAANNPKQAVESGLKTPGDANLEWGRQELATYLSLRTNWTVEEEQRAADWMIMQLLDRGAAAARRAAAARAQRRAAFVTAPWFAYPLSVAGPPSTPQSNEGSLRLQRAAGGALIGVGFALTVAAGTVARRRRSARPIPLA